MTNFEINKSIEILERTPLVIGTLLTGLSTDWIFNNEGGESWSPFDVVGHLIHGEKTDWIPRLKIITGGSNNKSFVPFDRFAQMNANKEKNINDLIIEFKTLRDENLKILKSTPINKTILDMKGIHPAFGYVTLTQLLAAWVVHDLGHISQVARVMAKQYKEDVGPWTEYLTILNK